MRYATYLDYNDKVMEYLEYIGYPDYVVMFEPDAVAHCIAESIFHSYYREISWRMCAIIIFAVTWEKIKLNINIVNYPVKH